MENKKSVCKVCFKCFANGKALGGHMTSHPFELRHPSVDSDDEYSSESTELPFQFSSASSSLDVHPKKKSKHNLRSVKQNPNPNSTFANFGGKSEIDFCFKYPTQQRSKRNRKFFNAARAKVENNQSSSTYVLSVVEAAETLMFMSMDTWQMPKDLQIYSSTSETHEGDDDGDYDGDDVEMEEE